MKSLKEKILRFTTRWTNSSNRPAFKKSARQANPSACRARHSMALLIFLLVQTNYANIKMVNPDHILLVH